MLIKDHTGRCGHCHAPFLRPGNRYCHVCGTRKGRGEFKPFVPYEIWSNDIQVVRFYICTECDCEWNTNSLVPDEQTSFFCPKCGEQSVELITEFLSG